MSSFHNESHAVLMMADVARISCDFFFSRYQHYFQCDHSDFVNVAVLNLEGSTHTGIRMFHHGMDTVPWVRYLFIVIYLYIYIFNKGYGT